LADSFECVKMHGPTNPKSEQLQFLNIFCATYSCHSMFVKLYYLKPLGWRWAASCSGLCYLVCSTIHKDLIKECNRIMQKREMCLCRQHSLWSIWNTYIRHYSTFRKISNFETLSLIITNYQTRGIAAIQQDNTTQNGPWIHGGNKKITFPKLSDHHPLITQIWTYS
jgi:hypothetical protein